MKSIFWEALYGIRNRVYTYRSEAFMTIFYNTILHIAWKYNHGRAQYAFYIHYLHNPYCYTKVKEKQTNMHYLHLADS